MLGDAWRNGKVALAFLTRLPVPAPPTWRGADLAASVPMFPVVGLVVGLLAGLAYAVATLVGLPPPLAAVVAIAALVWVTGGLHEDGLADSADGLGGTTPARRLEIMRDPRAGSFGVIALVLGLLARVGALAALQRPAMVATALVAAAVLSRAAIPVAMLALPDARADGLAARAGRPHPARVVAAGVVALALILVLLPPRAAVIVTACVAAVGVLLGITAWRQLGGRTGDVLGALQQVTEIAVLWALVAMWGPRPG